MVDAEGEVLLDSKQLNSVPKPIIHHLVAVEKRAYVGSGVKLHICPAIQGDQHMEGN